MPVRSTKNSPANTGCTPFLILSSTRFRRFAIFMWKYFGSSISNASGSWSDIPHRWCTNWCRTFLDANVEKKAASNSDPCSSSRTLFAAAKMAARCAAWLSTAWSMAVAMIGSAFRHCDTIENIRNSMSDQSSIWGITYGASAGLLNTHPGPNCK